MTKEYDIILISGEPYVDHPFCGVGILKRVLEDKGFSVGVIDHPDWKNDSDFKKLGAPRLFFGISSGSMDSMILNYTPLKKKRSDNPHQKMSYNVPERAIIVYSNMIRKLFHDSKIVIGGVESSLRRFTHYDYWSNKLRKPILFDSRADILVFGYGELQILEIAQRLKEGKDLIGIRGTSIISKEVPLSFRIIPSFDEVNSDKEKFCDMQNLIDVNKEIAQKVDTRYVLQNKAMPYTQKDLDYIYSLDYSRIIPDNYPEFRVIEFSVLTHRGCFGDCNFCSIAANTGKELVSRSKESILSEIKRITRIPSFNGQVELSGATANMYGMDCGASGACNNSCLGCTKLDKSHARIIELMREARRIPGIKKVIVRSGIRHDLAMQSPEYVKELIKYHLDETLMIAPEHVDPEVLKLMNKEEDNKAFIDLFKKICAEEKSSCDLSYYLMVGHPGCTIQNSKKLNRFITTHKNSEFVQLFTPTPMTVSTCMYYTALDPRTKKPIYVPYTYSEKKMQKNLALGTESASHGQKGQDEEEEHAPRRYNDNRNQRDYRENDGNSNPRDNRFKPRSNFRGRSRYTSPTGEFIMPKKRSKENKPGSSFDS